MAERFLTVTIPDALAHELESLSKDLVLELLERGLREVKIDRALDQYSRGGMSFGAAAERAGVSQSDLARYAYARGLQPPFSRKSRPKISPKPLNQSHKQRAQRLGAPAPRRRKRFGSPRRLSKAAGFRRTVLKNRRRGAGGPRIGHDPSHLS